MPDIHILNASIIKGAPLKESIINGDLSKASLINEDLSKASLINGDLSKASLTDGDILKIIIHHLYPSTLFSTNDDLYLKQECQKMYHKLDNDLPLIHNAVLYNYHHLIKCLANIKYDINACVKNVASNHDLEDMSALEYAYALYIGEPTPDRQKTIIQLLLAESCSITTTNTEMQTTLMHIAAQGNCLRAIKALLTLNSDLIFAERHEGRGDIPLFTAAYARSPNTFTYLFKLVPDEFKTVIAKRILMKRDFIQETTTYNALCETNGAPSPP